MRYDIVITKEPDHRYTARAVIFPELVVAGTSEADVLQRMQTALTTMHSQSLIVQIEVPSPMSPADDPWLRFAGVWQHDPEWDLFQTEIAAYRAEIDQRRRR